MNTPSPSLDSAQSIDYELLPAGPVTELANHDLRCLVDGQGVVTQLEWPWGGGGYLRRLAVAVSEQLEGELQPLSVRFLPGELEIVTGGEGIIITKRVALPWKTGDDRALIYLLECQAEGDRLLRVTVEIEWGEVVQQQLVDGLLVAQINPGPVRGVYGQRNADSTRVFGNPHGHPDRADLDDPTRATLVYHVLVNGTVEVPLLLTLSDVGEQVAWGNFLALREAGEMAEASQNAWTASLQSGRLWCPNPVFSRAVQQGKLWALRSFKRLRTGYAPDEQDVAHLPALVAALDTVDPVQSRNLLSHLRRSAERHDGRLPRYLPTFPDEATLHEPVGSLEASSAYLRALHIHYQHHADAEWLAQQWPVARRCADHLLLLHSAAAEEEGTLLTALQAAVALAAAAGDEIELERRRSDLENLVRRDRVGREPASTPHRGGMPPAGWERSTTWQRRTDRPWDFAERWQGIEVAAAAIWEGTGLRHAPVDGNAHVWSVAPAFDPAWPWWALLDLPYGRNERLSLLWDGVMLHATHPIVAPAPVALYRAIRIRSADEYEFDPYFELHENGSTAPRRFVPVW